MPSKSFWAKSSFTGEEDERDAGEASPDDEAGGEPPEGVSVKTTLGHVRRLASEVGVELCTRSTSAVVWRPNACATSKAVLPSLFLSEGLAPASKRTCTTDVWPAIQVRRGSKGMGGRFEAGGAPWLAAPMRAVPPAAHCTSGFAFRFSSALVIAKCPSMAAACSSVPESTSSHLASTWVPAWSSQTLMDFQLP